MAFLSNMTRPKGDPKVIRSGPSSFSSSDRLARNLGWFSIGLGMIELLAAEKVTGALGMRGKESLVRAFGVREITSGIITLSVDRQAGLNSRIAGDALDIATLATAMRPDNRNRDNATLGLLMVVGVTFLDIVATSANTIRHTRHIGQHRSYSDRSGFPRGLQAARGAARKKLEDLRATSGNEDPSAKRPAVAGKE